MLRARLTKRLDRFALDLEIACPAGSILALTGPSGSGKTTLLRLLAGLDRPDAGRIELDGEAWLDTGAGIFHKPRQRTIGLVFQEYSLFPHMTLAQNIAYATHDRAWARELLESFGIAHLAGARPGRMSGGERQRGALCQALARRPKLLLLDEPFSALDAATRRALRLELLRVRDRFRLPIIHITHDLAEAAQLGDAVLAMVDGRLNPDWFPLQVAQRLDEEAVLLARAGDPIFSQPHQPQGALL
ncbi:molybdate transport system ATP-binding protein [Humidesulfovibrio mexicanus]|uniref:Molybdate transport system ATP-binding protein n=1 Tax=Humidesulfovibrio mexicanus TaxID=147047 RepID=A0A239A0Z0_9BACT|nr:ATP-binding cassette domain-containing protein [Humidesulfovibrio mexicanus]SNR89315.1 molybdate transport system ATP-binding protein [Humidesulfovibrio mexicanus]